MSTRRARIKAVTSLPPRRKNADAAEANKSKAPPPIKDETPIEIPKTPQKTVPEDVGLNKSPAVKPSPALKSPKPIEDHAIAQNFLQILPGPSIVTPEIPKKGPETPKITENESSISNIAKPLFLSPKSVSSPLRKPTASPLVAKRIKTPEQMKEDVSHSVKSVDVNKLSTIVTAEVRNDVPEDYNVPSVPESITEDTVMDGIVPLQPVASAPKPIAILKNEIISENAEVLFDPIVPLPSPSKVRPKLRPVPRLAPPRRNSVQGSASESEDENRRALLSSGGTPALARQRHDSHTSHSTMISLPPREVSRVRNDSICSSVSQCNVSQPLLPVAASPVKEKHYTKSRRDAARRVSALRRRREHAAKGALTMYDLIFYNPTNNPIVLDEDELNLKAANEKEQEARKATKESNVSEEDADDPLDSAAPVPQIKLGPNGEIMLDEQSLVIKQSDSKRKVSKEVVHEGGWTGSSTGGRYKRTPRSADWSDAETVRFYRALAALGTDFMLMERLFPGRPRRELKLKFKKEERVNAAQVDRALRTSSKWDATQLLEEFKAEREAAEKRAQELKEMQIRELREEKERYKALKEQRVKQSRVSKMLGTSALSNPDDTLTADGIISRMTEQKALARKRKTETSEPRPCPLSHKVRNNIPGDFAVLTPTTEVQTQENRNSNEDWVTIQKMDPKDQNLPEILKSGHNVPSNIESGSLVVLTVNDPSSPSKKMLQTYIAHGDGRLTPVALPATFLNSVVSYMGKGTPRSNMSAGSSPRFTSPSSVASIDSRTCSTPGVQVNASPAKRQRHSSYTITQL